MAAPRRREPLKHINSYWHRLHERAELEDLWLHDLRHSFASQAVAIGEELPTIARLCLTMRKRTTRHLGNWIRVIPIDLNGCD